MDKFLEMLFCNDEFEFSYNGVRYAVISQYGRSLFEVYNNKLICSFDSNDDFYENATLDGRRLKDILDEIELH
jgi:hypothetical protein